MTGKTPKVDGYIRKNKTWQAELTRLREIILSSGLIEDVKWRCPCYTLDNNNVVLLNALKDYCAISFFKGALLKDPKRILQKPGENTQAARLIRFTDVKQIDQLEPALKAYIREAVKAEEAGLKVAFKSIDQFDVPAEFQARLDKTPALKKAFDALTPGRRRAYLLHFASAKQSKTRAARVEKCTPRILAGKGPDDK